MAVSAFLGQVDIGLIPYKEFMTAISGTEFGGVCLVTVTKHYPWKLPPTSMVTDLSGL